MQLFCILENRTTLSNLFFYQTNSMKLHIIAILLLFTFKLKAQDKITTTDKVVLEVKVIEVTKKYVKYELPFASNGTVSTIDIRYIKTIEYENGTIDKFGVGNPRTERPWGFSLGYLANSNTTGLLFLSDYFVTPKLEIGIGLGTLASVSRNSSIAVSGKYHFRNPESTSPISLFAGVGAISVGKDWSIQVPVGVHYLNHQGFKTSISLAPLTNFENFNAYFEIRAGYNFKKK